jgi:hypothetical protein
MYEFDRNLNADYPNRQELNLYQSIDVNLMLKIFEHYQDTTVELKARFNISWQSLLVLLRMSSMSVFFRCLNFLASLYLREDIPSAGTKYNRIGLRTLVQLRKAIASHWARWKKLVGIFSLKCRACSFNWLLMNDFVITTEALFFLLQMIARVLMTCIFFSKFCAALNKRNCMYSQLPLSFAFLLGFDPLTFTTWPRCWGVTDNLWTSLVWLLGLSGVVWGDYCDARNWDRFTGILVTCMSLNWITSIQWPFSPRNKL